MLTVAVAVAAVLLLILAAVLFLLYRGSLAAIAALEDTVRAQVAELDNLSIAGPLRVDTTTGSHDELPIRPDIRATLTAYCEGMWQHEEKP